MANVKLFVNLNSYHTLIARDDLGIVLDEPTKVLLQNINDVPTPLAFGHNAVKNSDDQFIVTPVMEGEIVDEKMCQAMMKNYVYRVKDENVTRMNAYLSVPCGLSLQGNQNCLEVMYGAGISGLVLVPNPVADLLNSELELENCLVIDIGAGSTDVAIVGARGIVKGATINVGALNMDMAIVAHVQSKYGVRVSLDKANSLKRSIGSLLPSVSKNLDVNGVDFKTGANKKVNITCFDILEAIHEFYQLIMDSVGVVLKDLDDDLLSEINSRQVLICGIGSVIEGLEPYASERLKMKVFVSKNEDNLDGLKRLSDDSSLRRNML